MRRAVVPGAWNHPVIPPCALACSHVLVNACPFGAGRLLRSLLAAVMVAGTLAVLLPLGVGAASAAGTPLARDAARAEVHRLINGERMAAGLRPLTVDLLLAGRAHDASFACPGGGSTPGRARDIALANGLTHELSGCRGRTIVDVMPAWGYGGRTGEILAYNYELSDMVTYRYGCAPGATGFGCGSGGTTTVVSATAATAVRQWIDSPSHNAIMFGDYDRFGCGAWSGTGSTVYGDGGQLLRVRVREGRPVGPGGHAQAYGGRGGGGRRDPRGRERRQRPCGGASG